MQNLDTVQKIKRVRVFQHVDWLKRAVKLIVITCCHFHVLHAEVISVYDIGTGSVKVHVLQHDIEGVRNLFFKRTKTFYPGHIVFLDDKIIKPEDIDIILSAIKELQQSSLSFTPNHSFAVATELFRQAKNGQDVIRYLQDMTGIEITIISQEQEGVFGFLGACLEGNFDPETAVVWDIGSGSFQITCLHNSEYVVYKAAIGLHAAFQIIAEGRQNEFIKALMDVPDVVRNKIADKDSIVIGIGAHPVLKIGKTTYCLQDIKEALMRDDLSANSHLMFVQAVFEQLAIRQVNYHYGPSSITTGALLCK